MKIPWHPARKKALLVVDVQPAFVNGRNRDVVDKIVSLLKAVKYDLYVETLFHTEKGSVWDVQQDWTLPDGETIHTVPELSDALKDVQPITIKKDTKSAFKSEPSLYNELKRNSITEVHLVGLDTNDCVFATACESFDLGFITYVIEECCQSSSGDQVHDYALHLLRDQCMTNNSCLEKVASITI